MAERERPTRERRDADEGFLRRWSRRKAEARSAPIEDASVPAEAPPASREQPAEPEKEASAPIDPKDLPDIESLDANSDFTVFMRPGVPEQLRALALRKLWRSDPIFSNLDGLVEYGEDYSIASWPKEAVRTAYKVGRGFLERLGEGAEGPDQALPTAPAGQPADEPARIAAAPAESLPPEAASPRAPGATKEPDSLRESGSPREPDAKHRRAAQPAAKRPRPLPSKG
jgi:Protein of unknown function (DUF3306)